MKMLNRKKIITVNKSLGFTLVELLLVIAIIGILSSTAVISLSSVKGKARDAQRLRDMQAIVTALTLYYEENGSYPATNIYSSVPPDPFSDAGWEHSHESGPRTFLQDLKDGGYLSEVPVDPINEWNSGDRNSDDVDDIAVYAYYLYSAGGPHGCTSNEDFYILGIRNLETFTRNHPSSPGIACVWDWNIQFDWVISNISPGN